MRRFLPIVCLFLSLTWFAAWGQTPTGEITGTVTDPTGAVVSGAVVVITNPATNVRRDIATNLAGIYDAPGLPPGAYSVRIAATGFRAEVSQIPDLQVGQIARVNFVLQVGNLSETVEVQGVAPTLDTDSATIGTVIENRRIQELPLNGRNYLQLITLAPGATSSLGGIGVGGQRMGGQRNDFGINIVGSRTQWTYYTLDGVVNTEPNFGSYMYGVSVDALQEFKVETGTYPAEYGHGVSQVTVITKSGTNEFHGTVFEFLRNSQLDAKNFFDSHTAPIPPFKRNQYGFTIGGPIIIPKVLNGRNKLFGFFDFEGLRQRKPVTGLTAMPLASDRVGNFSMSSVLIYDPATRVTGPNGQTTSTPFAGNMIPASRIDPISTYMLNNYFPLPNLNQTSYLQNYLSNEGGKVDSDQELARVDYSQSPNSNFFFRYNHTNEPQYIPGVIPERGTVNTTVIHMAAVGHTWVIGADKVNEFKAGLSRLESYNGNLHEYDPAYRIIGKLGIPGVSDTPLFYGVPDMGISNFGNPGDPSNGPYNTWDNVFQYGDNFSWNRGKHGLKFGAEYRRTQMNITGNDVARGRFGWNGQYTINPGGSPKAQNDIADMLLGDLSTAQSQQGVVDGNLRNYSLSIFAEDSWKVTPKVVVNYGVRYEYEPGWSDKRDRIVNVDFRWDNSMQPTIVRAGTGDPFQGSPSIPILSTIKYVRDGRFGNTTTKPEHGDFAPRVGIAYTMTPRTVIRAGFGIFYIHDIANAQFDVLRNPPFTLRRQETANTLFPNLTWEQPFVLPFGAPSLSPGFQWSDPTGYTPQWSFTFQRQLDPSTSAEVAYVGSSGVHLERTLYYNDSRPGPPGNMAARYPFVNYYLVQMGTRPGHSNYHSMQGRVQRRFKSGLTVLSSLTWSKSMDNAGTGVRGQSGGNGGGGDPYNLKDQRGPSAFDFRRRLTTSLMYTLPFGKGRALLGGANRVLNAIVGDWQMSGILTFQDGFPFGESCSSNATYQNTNTGCDADSLGINPNLPNDQRIPTHWFNTAAFTDRVGFVPGVGPYRFGNAGRSIITGPGIIELDGSVMKSFRFTENTKLDFRGELFNIPNHPIFASPASTIGSTTNGIVSATRVDSRQMQFALKLNF